MAFPSTLPLYHRFYEHGHAVTFIRQRLMSRLNDSLGCEILFDNPAIIFPPPFFLFFSTFVEEPCFPDQDRKRRDG